MSELKIPEDLKEAYDDGKPLPPDISWQHSYVLGLIERIARLEARTLSCVFCNIQLSTVEELKRHLAACVEYQGVIENAALKAQLTEARKEAQSLRDGNNYIKQFVSAKDKCSAMYPPDEVYTEEQLSCWAEENGFIKPNPLMDDENAALKDQVKVLSAPLSAEEKDNTAFRFGGGSVANQFTRILVERLAAAPFAINPPTESEEKHGHM